MVPAQQSKFTSAESIPGSTGVTVQDFKKRLTEGARGKALNRRRDVLSWKVESSPSWGQVREGELR